MAYDLHKEAKKFGGRREKLILWYDEMAKELGTKIDKKGAHALVQTVELTKDEIVYLRDACIEMKQQLLGH